MDFEPVGWAEGRNLSKPGLPVNAGFCFVLQPSLPPTLAYDPRQPL